MNIRAGRIAGTALLGMSLLLATAVGMPQGKGPKNGGPSRGSSGNAGNRDSGNATGQRLGHRQTTLEVRIAHGCIRLACRGAMLYISRKQRLAR